MTAAARGSGPTFRLGKSVFESFVAQRKLTCVEGIVVVVLGIRVLGGSQVGWGGFGYDADGFRPVELAVILSPSDIPPEFLERSLWKYVRRCLTRGAGPEQCGCLPS